MTTSPRTSNPAKIRLTQTAKRAGCAAKHPPGYLLPLLAGLPAVTDPRVLVGSSTADDAAVIRLDENRAIVFTTDFFTPIVDDPYEFGAVAATNALSDIYAMGGTPLSALNLVGFPDQELPAEILREILRGGIETAKKAGCEVVGGHTIKSDEPIYGLAVIGEIHPEKIVSNAGAKPGDVLVLTKPLGVGIIATASKLDQDSQDAMPMAIEMMTHLNAGAGQAMVEIGVNACTDITGFGLLGHARNMLAASGVSAEIELSQVPVMKAASIYVREGIAPGGTHANWRFLADWVEYDSSVSKEDQLILADAQTSGGLLISVDPTKLEPLLQALRKNKTPVQAVIGTVTKGLARKIRIKP